MRREYRSEDIERKWIERWDEAKLSRAVRGKPGEKKFMLHFAYPGISGYLHVGHMRGFTYSDVFCRFHRMTGHRVLFPAGFHASGIPSVGLARKVERGDPTTLEYLRNNGCPPAQIPKLKDPLEVVRYFSGVYAEEYWKRFGFLIDWQTLCTTIDPGYNRFIEWQFRKLKDADLLVVKPHFAPFCPVDGAVAVDASETDISKGGSAEAMEYVIVPFRLPNGDVLPCATLRPETTFGVTNIWLEPTTAYRRVRVGVEHWILSEPAAQKLAGQRDGVEDEPKWTKVAASEVIGKEASNPLTRARVPILPGPFVDPRRATGVVMSVPGHAPYDWQALREIRPEIQPIVLIRLPGVSGVPAEAACRKHEVKSQLDKAALDAATEEAYADEFHAGIMMENTGGLAGLKVSEAKEKVRGLLYPGRAADVIQDFNSEVVCRCGRDVLIRRIPDQWFIKYSDETLTRTAQAHAKDMRIFPEEYHRDMPQVLDWFGDRACIRRGSWLGTEFPFKAGWIIEPISDSTLYSAYYTVSPYVKAGTLRPEDLTDAFFDYAFLGKGKPTKPVWDEVRKDFEFWYPVDVNLGGKEHKTVHFPPYVMNHAAILPKERWPRGIFVNWWVTQKAGAKISKSKGGAEPIPGAARTYSVDGMRLYYCNVASPHVDIEWDPEIVTKYRQHVERLYQFTLDFADEPEGTSPPGVDAWLAAAWTDRWRKARASFEGFDLRSATQQLYYEFYNDLLWFRRRGGRRDAAATRVLREWAAALTPVTPFLAEELWAALVGTGLSSVAQVAPAGEPAHAELAREDYLRGILEDVGNIARVAKITPKRILMYTAPAWKSRVLERVRASVAKGSRNVGDLIKENLADPDLRPFAKDVSSFVQRAFKEALDAARKDGHAPVFDEFQVLSEARVFLAKELGVAALDVHRADDADAPDPGRKKGVASPLKPALFLE